MNRPAVRAEVLRALLGYYELLGIIQRAFAAGAPSDRVRCSEVATAVAESAGAELSPQFRRRVRHAASLGGWKRVVRAGNVAMYRGMVRR